MLENPVVSGYGFPPIEDAKIVAECACGCGEEIVVGYEHIECDGEWFYDTPCLLKWIGAQWKVVGEDV